MRTRLKDYIRYETRRQFLSRGSNAVSWAAHGGALGREGLAAAAPRPAMPLRPRPPAVATAPGWLHFAPKAKQVIYLHMVGGPPQMDMYDYKPAMGQWFDKDLPDSIRDGPALDDHDLGAEAVSDRTVEVQVRPARPVRHVGL